MQDPFLSIKQAGTAPTDVLLVVPPFRSIVRPALGVSQMLAVLREQGVCSQVLYLNLCFADVIGAHLHEMIAARYGLAIGDFIFSSLVFDRPSNDAHLYVKEVLLRHEHGAGLAHVLTPENALRTVNELIEVARAFTEQAAEEILSRQPRIVGLSSSYQENMACLAIARRLKEKNPQVVTIMGGANCQGVMGEELLARFPCLDYVGNGECDLMLSRFANAIVNKKPLAAMPGLFSRDPAISSPHAALLTKEEFEALPFSDFSDYFDQLGAAACRNAIVPGLALETSRGCWWGAKHQCRFCGLNGSHLGFRSRSAGRVMSEIRTQISRHHVHSIEVVDNILDMTYFRTLFPQLAAEPQGRFFWETSGGLTHEQMRLLAAAGVTHIQAGIESLSDRSLKLMNKPTSALRNIQTLKWSGAEGVNVLWSHLFGIPDEDESEAEGLARLMECLHHLKPPAAAHLIRLQRFSHYFGHPEQYGFGEVRPALFYQHIYPGLPPESLSRLAYHFDHQGRQSKRNSSAYTTLSHAVTKWRKGFRRSRLIAVPRGEELLILDTRSCARKRLFRLQGDRRAVLEFCDKARRMDEISEQLKINSEPIVKALVDDRLVLRMDDCYLSLPIQMNPAASKKRLRTRMPGGHLKRTRFTDAIRLLKQTRISGIRLLILVLRETPTIAAWASLEIISRIMNKTLSVMLRILLK